MQLLFLAVALIVCITVHEAAHAWTAYKLGDPTAKSEGRVSLNPLKHLDPLGTIMIFIAHFGWGKPTPFNYQNLKHPRRDAALISVAGPLSNLLTAALIAVIFKSVGTQMPLLLFGSLQAVFQLSIILFLFNLLPIAPLDGSKIVAIFIPRSRQDWYYRFVGQGPLILIVMVIADRIIAETSGFSFLGIFFGIGYELIASFLLLGS